MKLSCRNPAIMFILFASTFLSAGENAAQASPVGAFNYPPIADPIVSATFSVDFAALTANRTLFGQEVNTARLIDLGSGLPDFDLSDDLFGTAAFPSPPLIGMGSLGTGIVSANIDPLFFPALTSGHVGLWSLFTDTDDGLFAIDFISLTIDTSNQTIVAFHGSDNNGFGIALPDGGTLPSALPTSISIGATGTGFDESISSKSIHVIPEPGTIAFLATGVLWWISRRRCGPLHGLVRGNRQSRWKKNRSCRTGGTSRPLWPQ